MMAHDLIEGFFAWRAFTKAGTLPAILGGGNFWKKAPRFFFFSSVLGGYLCQGD